MDYVPIKFHVLIADFQPGLTVKLIRVPDKGLVPFGWDDGKGKSFKATHFPRLVNGDTHEVDVFGGTREQFIVDKETHIAYCETRGWKQGQYRHLPMNSGPTRPMSLEEIQELVKGGEPLEILLRTNGYISEP